MGATDAVRLLIDGVSFLECALAYAILTRLLTVHSLDKRMYYMKLINRKIALFASQKRVFSGILCCLPW